MNEELFVYSLICSRFDICKLKVNEFIKKFYKNYNVEKINERSKMCRLISDVDCYCRELEAILNG